jgi:hypothetical protein
MTAVERYFFTPLYYPRSVWSVFSWWEARRPVFNLCVGAAGLLTVIAFNILSVLPPHPGSFGLPWRPILAYAILANACYSLGPLADLFLRRQLGERAPAVGPVLLRYGFVFSVGLTLLPIAVGGLSWLFQVLF